MRLHCQLCRCAPACCGAGVLDSLPLLQYRAAAITQYLFRDTVLKIIVRNLDRQTTQDTLLALFQSHGRVQSCTIVMDELTGSSKGFGFVNMPVPGEAKAAIQHLNGMELEGSRIRVKKAVATQKPSPAANEPVADANAVTATEARVQGDHEQPRLKKDGTPLGPRKARTFRKKQGD